jgi:DUF971 family protein
MQNETQPQSITVDRAGGQMHVIWQDGHHSDYTLRWLRTNCPCATCREERYAAATAADPLRLVNTPAPSLEVAGAEFVGHYAIRFTWQDGHGSGIYPFAGLRACCPCALCNPNGQPSLIEE